MKIASRLNIVRVELGMKQQELLQIMKEQNGSTISASAMSQLCRGATLPEFVTAFMILKALRTRKPDLRMEDVWVEAES